MAGRSEGSGLLFFGRDIAVEFGLVVVPLEGVKLCLTKVVRARDGNGTAGEGILRHIHAAKQIGSRCLGEGKGYVITSEGVPSILE